MIQKPIKLRAAQPTRFEIEEVDANWKELDDRTKLNKPGYNSLAEQAARLQALELATETTTIQNQYLTIAAMLVDQARQSVASLQYVADASADPTVVSGYAYYEKLVGNTASLSNYRKLTASEVEVITQGRLKIRDQVGNEFEAKLAIIYGIGFTATQNPDGSFNLNYTSAATAPKQKTYNANFIFKPLENDYIIITEGKTATLDLVGQTYPEKFITYVKNDGIENNFVIIAKTGSSYQLNDGDAVSLTTGTNVTLTMAKGATFTIVRKGSTDKYLIDGGIK